MATLEDLSATITAALQSTEEDVSRQLTQVHTAIVALRPKGETDGEPFWDCFASAEGAPFKDWLGSALGADGAGTPNVPTRLAAARVYLAWMCAGGCGAYGVKDAALVRSAVLAVRRVVAGDDAVPVTDWLPATKDVAAYLAANNVRGDGDLIPAVVGLLEAAVQAKCTSSGQESRLVSACVAVAKSLLEAVTGPPLPTARLVTKALKAGLLAGGTAGNAARRRALPIVTAVLAAGEAFTTRLASTVAAAASHGSPAPPQSPRTPARGTPITPNLAISVTPGRAPPSARSSAVQQLGTAPAVIALIQHLAAGAPDRADARNAVCDTVLQLMDLLPTSCQRHIVAFVAQLSRNKRSKFRVVAVDLAAKLLTSDLSITAPEAADTSVLPLPLDTTALSMQASPAATGGMPPLAMLWNVVSARSGDRVAGVRSRGVAVLSTLAASPAWPPPNGVPVMPMLLRRRGDVSAAVRRAVLQAMNAVSAAGTEAIDSTVCGAILNLCADTSVMVRKAAATVVDSLYTRSPDNVTIATLWLDGLLPLVADNESSVAAKALDSVHTHIVQPASVWKPASNSACWRLCANVADDVELQLCLRKAMGGLLKAGTLKSSSGVVRGVQRVAASDQPAPNVRGAWLLFAELAKQQDVATSSSQGFDFVVDAWRGLGGVTEDNAEDAARLLEVLGLVSARLEEAVVVELAKEFLEALAGFGWPAAPVSAAITAVGRFAMALQPSHAAATRFVTEWARPLLEATEDVLCKAALPDEEPQDTAAVTARLFVVGELAALGLGDAEEGTNALGAEAGDAHDVTGSSRVRVQVPMPTHVVTLVHSLVTLRDAPDAVRGHAFVALGKACLRDPALAKSVVTMLVRELVDSDAPMLVRNNILLVLSDLCKRYTSLVDAFVPNMAACMRDAAPLVRRHAIVILTQLLVEDYIKLKGALLFQFVAALGDDVPAIQALARASLDSVLTVKSPLLLSSHFVETVFVLHGCRAHPGYLRVVQDAEAAGAAAAHTPGWLAMPGPDNARRRNSIYTSMLGLMPAEHRLTVAARLTQDVLGGVMDGTMPLDGSGADANGVEALVTEVLHLLNAPELKIGKPGGGGGGGDGDDDAEASGSSAAAVAMAKSRLLSKLAAKNLSETLLPVLVGLKRTLAAARSPVIGTLMQYMASLYRGHKAEMEEFLAADEEMKAEVLYDLRQMGAAKSKKRRLAPDSAVANVLKSPMPGSGMRPPLATPASLPRLRRRVDAASPTQRIDFSGM